MLSAWTQHLRNDPKAKQEFEEYVKGSKPLLNRLNEILDELEKSLDRSEIKPEVFDNPNWAYLQAYKNGYRGSLEKIKTLISIDPKE